MIIKSKRVTRIICFVGLCVSFLLLSLILSALFFFPQEIQNLYIVSFFTFTVIGSFFIHRMKNCLHEGTFFVKEWRLFLFALFLLGPITAKYYVNHEGDSERYQNIPYAGTLVREYRLYMLEELLRIRDIEEQQRVQQLNLHFYILADTMNVLKGEPVSDITYAYWEHRDKLFLKIPTLNAIALLYEDHITYAEGLDDFEVASAQLASLLSFLKEHPYIPVSDRFLIDKRLVPFTPLNNSVSVEKNYRQGIDFETVPTVSLLLLVMIFLCFAAFAFFTVVLVFLGKRDL